MSYQIDDIIIRQENSHYIIRQLLEIKPYGFKTKLLKTNGTGCSDGDMTTKYINHYYRLITDLEKIKYL